MNVRASAKIHPYHPAPLMKKDQRLDFPSYGHPNHKEVVMAFGFCLTNYILQKRVRSPCSVFYEMLKKFYGIPFAVLKVWKMKLFFSFS